MQHGAGLAVKSVDPGFPARSFSTIIAPRRGFVLGLSTWRAYTGGGAESWGGETGQSSVWRCFALPTATTSHPAVVGDPKA